MSTSVLLPPCLQCLLPNIPKIISPSDLKNHLEAYTKNEKLLQKNGCVVLNPALKRILLLGNMWYPYTQETFTNF